MDDFSLIKKHIAKYIQLTEEEESYFISILKVTTVKKRQFIIQPGFVSNYRNFVIAGGLRSYYVDIKGQEYTIQFAVEDWWITDFNSYIFQQPATLFVEAFEPTTILQISFEAEQTLLKNCPIFEKYFRIVAQRGIAFLQRRILSNLSMTAEERYEAFIQLYPAIANRVPQYTLASYIGISTEFLSKIRNKRTKKS